MLGYREQTVDDYLAILRRRVWVIVILAVIGCVTAYLVSLKLPNRYTSRTLVLIEEQRVPDNFVKSVVTGDLNERLASMQEQILSRSRLQPIVERFNLFNGVEGRTPMEEVIDRLRAGIVVTPVRPMAETQTNMLPGFSIAVTLGNPQLAQQVCTEITSMFMNENLRLRQQRAEGTNQFLENQLQEAKSKLDEQDGKQAAFKRRYAGVLPGQEQTNLGILMALNTQVEAVTQALNRTQQDKAFTESLLAQQAAAWEAGQDHSRPGQSLEEQLAGLQDQLGILEAHYTSDYPDVTKTKNDIAQLKQKIAAKADAPKEELAVENGKKATVDPPQIQQLRAQIHQYELTLREKAQQAEQLRQQIKVYEARVQLSPQVEQEYKQITREYQTALDFYDELLRKKEQSKMAVDLERRQEGEQFRVLDAASLPEKPSFPNRPLFALSGLGGGLALGVGIAFVLEFKDRSLRNEDDVECYLELPILAVIPTIESQKGKRARAREQARGKDAQPDLA